LARGEMAEGWVMIYSPDAYCSAAFEYGGKTHSARMSLGFYGGGNDVGREVVFLFDPQKPANNIIYDPSRSWWVPVKD
jgi:hypothetical protein